jgi:hypothetical protein
MEGGWLMSQMLQTVTLWLAWYREKEGLDEDLPGRPLRLKMLYASSRDEARLEAQQWLVRQKGLLAQDLERLEPSPYGLQFQRR